VPFFAPPAQFRGLFVGVGARVDLFSDAQPHRIIFIDRSRDQRRGGAIVSNDGVSRR
jgi:hypothetical protein